MKSRNLILSIIMAVSAVTAHAYDIEVDGIQYNVVSLSEMTLSVCGYTPQENVIIPSTVTYNNKTFTVIGIDENTFDLGAQSIVHTLSLPGTIRFIKQGGIKSYYNDFVPKVYFPNGNNISELEFLAIGGDFFDIDLDLSHLKKYKSRCIYNDRANVILSNDIETIENEHQPHSFSDETFMFGEFNKLVIPDNANDFTVTVPDGKPLLTSDCNELYYGRKYHIWETDESKSEESKTVKFEVKKKMTIGQYLTDITDVYLNDVDTVISYADNPPTLGDVTNKSYIEAIVFVPSSALSKYKNHPQWSFFWNLHTTDELVEKSQCDKPVISYADGKLKIESSTSGSICFYSISDADVVNNAPVSGDINLTATYNITAYATADGYEKSETATATLCYIDGTFNTDGIETPQAAKRAVVISSNGGILTISGVEPGEEVSLYSISGSKITSVKASTSSVILDGKSLQSNVGIIKIGNESIKIQVK